MEQLKEMQEAEKFFEENPKTLQQLLAWEETNLKRLQERVNELSEETGEEFTISRGELAPMVYGAFAMTPRFMFEFLDENNIIIEIRKQESGFFYTLDGVTEEGTFYQTRVETEKVAFKQAIVKLEKQIA